MTVWINGVPWHVTRVRRNSLALVDRTGRIRLATTDPGMRVIYVSEEVEPGMLRHVMAHELTHACMVSHGLLNDVKSFSFDHVRAEEWVCGFVADHAREILEATAQALK